LISISLFDGAARILFNNLDGLVKSRKFSKIVIPTKAGIQKYQLVTKHWTPVFTGVTTFYDFNNLPG